MPRSLGSVLSSLVVRFLSGWRGVMSRGVATPVTYASGVAVSRDGATLFVSDEAHAVHAFRVSDGMHLRSCGSQGRGVLQFLVPRQIAVSPDDLVFVAEEYNRRIQVLTQRLDFYGFVGLRQLANPTGVCADTEVVVVAEAGKRMISVFSRHDNTLIRRFEMSGLDSSVITSGIGLCFMAGHRHIAVADDRKNYIEVFSLEGTLTRRICGYENPVGVACDERSGELYVACADFVRHPISHRVVVFSSSDEVLFSAACANALAVAFCGNTLFVQQRQVRGQCRVFTFW
jgi:DNA-binding beta-propeller fold protein YncE